VTTQAPSILFLIDSLGQGGAEQVLANLAPELKSEGFDCEVICVMNPSIIGQDLEKRGVKVHRLNLSHRWNMIEAYLKLRPILKSRSFTFVHGHLYFGTLYAVLAQMVQPSSVLLSSYHGFEFDRDLPDSVLHRLRLKFRKWILRKKVLRSVAVSDAVRDHYKTHLGLNTIVTIPNALSNEVFGINIKNPQLGKKTLSIGVPARLIPEKGHLILIESLQRLKKEGLIPLVFLYGEGGFRSKIQDAIKANGLEEQVFLLGNVSHRELLSKLIEHTLVVLPSLSEGFGIAATEAMALGIPVIATNTGGFAGVIENGRTGILVEPSNPEALANAIRAALSGEIDLRLIATNARVEMKRKFAMDVVIERWKDFYRGMIS